MVVNMDRTVHMKGLRHSVLVYKPENQFEIL